jgi:hypothetical protein
MAGETQAAINALASVFMCFAVGEEQILRSQLDIAPPFTAILQAEKLQGTVEHAAVLIEDDAGTKYVWEKDGMDPVAITPLADWHSYEQELPATAVCCFGSAHHLLRNI